MILTPWKNYEFKFIEEDDYKGDLKVTKQTLNKEDLLKKIDLKDVYKRQSSNSKKKKKAQAGNGNVPPSGMPQQPNGAVVPPNRAPEQPKAPYEMCIRDSLKTML